MERLGYTPAVRALLEKPFLDLGAMLRVDKKYACDPARSAWACAILELEDDPVWKFLRTKAPEVVWYEALVSTYR